MSDRPAPDKTSPTVATSGHRGVGVGGDVTDSNIFTGDIKIESPVTTALHQLRAPVGDFVGRETEIDTLINALRRETRRASQFYELKPSTRRTGTHHSRADRKSQRHESARATCRLAAK